jgi:hypothetical protein
MDKECKFGQTVQNTKVGIARLIDKVAGLIIRLRDSVCSTMWTVIGTAGNGRTIEPMATVCTNRTTGQSMRECGETITSMAPERRFVKITGNSVGIDGSWYEGEYVDGRKDGKGKYVWPDGSYYEGGWKDNKINGYVTNFIDWIRESIAGSTVAISRETGRTTTCTVMESTSGRMGASMKANINSIKNKYNSLPILSGLRQIFVE